MVLAELGKSINAALQKLNKAPVVDEALVDQILGEIAMALLKADVNAKFIKKLREDVKMEFKLCQEENVNHQKLIQKSVVDGLTRMLESDRKPFQPKKGKQNVIMFVGLQGSGKTTTCTKYAYYYQKKGWKVALVCADTFRAGAFDQLKQNATKVRVPFYGSYTEADPVQIAQEGVNVFKKEAFEIIIVDTSGRHKQENDLFEEMKQVEAAVKPDDIVFVMDSSIGQACFDQALAFKKAVNVGSVIITKLDGHAKGGGALSAVAATESPIVFIGEGEHFDDLESFEASSFVRRLLGLGDINKLFQSVKDVVNMRDQPQLIQKLKEGKFSIRDLQTQFNSVLKLGSLNQFMSAIPGMGSSVLSKGNEKESIKRIQRFLCIMNSMTSEELDGEGNLNFCRIVRIAKGSGTSIEEVHILLDEHKKLSKVVGNLAKTNLGGKRGNEFDQLKRNPQQMMQKMKGAIDPSMLQKLGGMENVMNMMKQMGQMDGIQDLMKQMGGMGGMPGTGKGKRR
ncbi:unnamed protein product [Paramecium sonneborni]|uniref:Signal recognition particle 54 kDa protein n=1 Tax=Paramecium sonneborni TaxID=65129 RepID=A0A8S1L3W7_9CILI|nr:unnamed protein product [Paramecium sonneborni]